MFTGSLNLQRLPQSLEMLYCSDNTFEGEVRFDNLPTHMQRLCLENNIQLHGVLDKTLLPKTLHTVVIDRTSICEV